jgi:asparagine synthase (glutamine-hydrolysing)
MKYRNNETKWVLRRVLEKHVPKKLWERPKAGFSVPIERWLNHELREWAGDLLSEENIKKAGIIDYRSIRIRREKYLKGMYHGCAMWHVLMFQDWLQKNSGGSL